jgi:hypothetical protein
MKIKIETVCIYIFVIINQQKEKQRDKRIFICFLLLEFHHFIFISSVALEQKKRSSYLFLLIGYVTTIYQYKDKILSSNLLT